MALKKLIINCAFGDENQLNKILRNRLVVGVKEDAIRNRLLAEHDLSWKRACEVAIQMDMARYGSKLIHAQSSVNAVKQHKLQQQRRKSPSHVDSDQKCYHCHGKHKADACRFNNAECFNCNKIGHISKACRNKGDSKTEFRGNYNQKRGGRTNKISHDDDEALYEVSDVASVNVVGSAEVKVDVDINGTPISFTVEGLCRSNISQSQTCTILTARESDKELDKQVEAGILKKVERPEWASPVMIVPKPDGSVRICSDYKVSINKVVEDTPYPLPTADDIFSTLAGDRLLPKLTCQTHSTNSKWMRVQANI